MKRTKPDTPIQPGNSCKGGPGTSDPGLFTCTRAALAILIAHAYHLEFYELVAPKGPKVEPVRAAVESKYSMKMVNGYLRLEFVKKPFSALAGVLSGFLSAAVNDETALTEPYTFTLDFMPDDRWRGFSYMPKPASAPDAAPLEAAIKAQLGLTLEKRDGMLRVLVVDNVQKIPTENEVGVHLC